MSNACINVKPTTKTNLLKDSEALKKKVKKVYLKFDILEVFRLLKSEVV